MGKWLSKETPRDTTGVTPLDTIIVSESLKIFDLAESVRIDFTPCIVYVALIVKMWLLAQVVRLYSH